MTQAKYSSEVGEPPLERGFVFRFLLVLVGSDNKVKSWGLVGTMEVPQF